MTHFRVLCLLAVGVFVFVGCDNNDNGNGGNTIDRVTITSIEINEFPEDKPDGSDWDSGTGPDIYFILFDDDTGAELDGTEGDEFRDVENGDLPLIWDGNYTSRDLDRPLAIELYDEDPGGGDTGFEFMGSTEVFRLEDRFDRSTMTISGPDISILLRLEWD